MVAHDDSVLKLLVSEARFELSGKGRVRVRWLLDQDHRVLEVLQHCHRGVVSLLAWQDWEVEHKLGVLGVATLELVD